jgi:hypothetical protein
LRPGAQKSSKSGTFPTGKIIPLRLGNARETTGTTRPIPPFHRQHENGRMNMYIGLGGLLILILILWLLGVI